MNDKSPKNDESDQRYFTRLSHAGRAGTNVRGFVNLPPSRTDSAAHYNAAIWRQTHDEHSPRKKHIQRNLTPQ
mgnify:CR=1 FL=1